MTKKQMKPILKDDGTLEVEYVDPLDNLPIPDGMQVVSYEDNRRLHRAKGQNYDMQLHTVNGAITQFFMVYNNDTIPLPINPNFPFILAITALQVYKKYAAAESGSDPEIKPIPRREAERGGING